MKVLHVGRKMEGVMNSTKMENKIKNKKGLEAPSNLMILVIFIVTLAVIIILALVFRDAITESEAFQRATDFSGGLKW